MWLATFSALSVTVCIFSALATFWRAMTAARASESQARRLRSCESRVDSLKDSLESTQHALEIVANRLKMTRVRNAAEHVKGSSDEPDPYKNPDEWRSMMNKRLAESRHGIKS